MIRGVSFNVIPGPNVLYQILKCMSPEKYCWYNIDSQYEDWNSNDETVFFDEDYYDGETFLQQIILDHYILFIKLQAYFEIGEFYDIHSYDEFKNSDCQLMLFIYDCRGVDIYAKDPVMIKDIYENALMNRYTGVKYITDSNDERTKMVAK